MSLILDALKRAERERQPGPGGALDDLPARPAARRRWLRPLALAVLVLVAVAVAVTVARRPRSAAPAAIEQARAPAPAPAPRPLPGPQPQAQPAPPADTGLPAAAPPQAPAQAPPSGPIRARPVPNVIPGTEGVSSLDELTPESDVDLEPAAPPPTAEPAPRPPQVDAPARSPEPAAGPEAEAEAPASAARPQAAPEGGRPAIPPALTQKAPVRRLREMPPDYRADFPALTMEVHVFEPNRRFVMINGRRYKEGERIAEGPQIVEIVRDGVVFDYRGEKVLFPIGR